MHRLESLAPRDVVARAIDPHLKQSGDPYALLDLSPIDDATLKQRFPNILAEWATRSIDATREPLPVVPAAHYTCGGVWTDRHGCTSLPGLVCGRGSVLYWRSWGQPPSIQLVTGGRCIQPSRGPAAADRAGAAPQQRPSRTLEVRAQKSLVAQYKAMATVREGLRALMWNHAGIVRTTERLTRAEQHLTDLRARVDREYNWHR